MTYAFKLTGPIARKCDRAWKFGAAQSLATQNHKQGCYSASRAIVTIKLGGKHHRSGSPTAIAGALLYALVEAKVLRDSSLSCVLRVTTELHHSASEPVTFIEIEEVSRDLKSWDSWGQEV